MNLSESINKESEYGEYNHGLDEYFTEAHSTNGQSRELGKNNNNQVTLLATDTTTSSYRKTKHLNVRYKMVELQYLFTHHH